MAFDVEGARKAGYNDEEIAGFLGKQSNFDVLGATKAGYGYGDIINHLAAQPPKAAAKPTAPAPVPEEDNSSDFMRGVGNVPGSFQETYGGAKALAGLLSGSKDLVKSGLESMEEGKARQTSKESDSFTDAWHKGIGTVLTDWLPYQMGSGVGNLAETGTFMLLGGVAGAVGGAGVGAAPGALAGVVSKTLIKQGIKEAAEKIAKESGKEAAEKFVQAEAKKVITDAGEAAAAQYAKVGAKEIGKTAGMVSQAGIHGAGEVTGRAAEEAQKQGKDINDVELSRVVPAAIAHGVADYFVNKIGLGALKIGEKSMGNLALDIGKQIAVTGTKEVPAELIQTMAERYGANLSLADAEALKEYGETVAASYGMAVGPGAVGGARTRVAKSIEDAAKLSATSEDQLRREATNQAPPPPGAPPPPNAELVSMLTPAAGENNQTLAKLSEDTIAAQDEVKKAEAAKAAEEATKIKSAEDLITRADAGEKIKRGDIHAMAKEVGIEKFPAEIKTNKDKIEHLRAHIGQEKAPQETASAAAPVSEAVQKATNYLAKLDSGEVKEPQAPMLGSLLKQLGIERPESKTPGWRNRAIEAIRNHIAAQGEPNVAGTVNAPAGIGTQLPTPPAANVPTGGATTAQPNGMVSAGTNVGPANVGEGQQPGAVTTPAAPVVAAAPPVAAPVEQTKPKTIEDLSPELQAHIAERKDAIKKLEAEGKDATKKKDQLNKLLAKHGITGTLAARKSIEKDFLEEGELPYAVPGEEKTDQQLEAERQAAYEESLGKTTPNYQVSEEDKRLYNETREETNKEAEASNERRKELVAEYDTAMKAFDEAEGDAQEEAALQRIYKAEDALQEHGPVQHLLPEYEKKFAADYKDVYFGNIKYGNKAEHRQAAKALQEYLARTGGREQTSMAPQERRIVNAYEENRAEHGKMFGVSFPRWADLTNEQKQTYQNEIVNNAGQQQQVGFAKLGVKLIQDSRNMSEGEKREKQNAIDRQEQVRRESEAQQEKDRKTREAYERNKPFNSSLPNALVQMVMNNDLQGVLKQLSETKTSALTSPYKRILKAVAQSLYDMKLNTQIKIVDDLKGDLAQYDPATDTIYITREGLSSNTIIHEVVHAGTVKVINEYLNGNRKSLSMGQLNAIRQLEQIMNETRDSLATDHPEAYKNLFEFVSYALTSDQLQQDLHDESIASAGATRLEKDIYGEKGEAPGTNLPENKSQWSKFKLSIARILKVRDDYLTKGKLDKNVAPNYVMEIAAAFEDILVKPTEPIFLPALPAVVRPKKGAAQPKKVATPHKAELGTDNPEYHLPREDAPMPLREKLARMKGNINTWRNAARIFQDDRYRIKAHDRILDMSGKLIREGKDKMNNVYEQIVLAVGDAKNFFNVYVSEPAKNLDLAVKEFADSTGYKTKRALEELHKILEAIHEPERRMVKYLLSVPLSTKKNLTHNGNKISAAQRRVDIVSLLNNHVLSQAQAKQLREELDSIVFEKDANGQIVLDPEGYPKPNMTYVDAAGSSPKPKNVKGEGGKAEIRYTSEHYNATGIDLADAKKIRDDLKNSPQADSVQKVTDALQQLHNATTEMNKLANYWSQPVSNRVAFYGFENYIPLKGNPKHADVDEDIDFDSRRNGRELQDNAGAMGGRVSVSKNPVLQTMTDATRAALRAGRRNLTQSIKNAIKDKTLAGSIKKTIKFEERETVDLSDLKGETTIFHYNDDGSIDVLVVSDKNLRDSIRRTYEKSNPLVEFANKWTSRIGQMHTRYNYNFAPLNFVRDALTNTWNISASELGPVEAARYLKNVAFLTANGGMYKAMQVAILYPKGDTQSLRALETLTKKDPYIRDMVEYIRQGGMVSHLDGMSLQSNFADLHKKVGKSGILTSVEDINRFADVWTNMFELASRASAYSVAKNNFMQKDKLSEAEARTKAAVFTKNLANFEQVGEWGKAMGALYMFARPAATGAVRAIEAVAPAFTSEKSAMSRLPPEIAADPVASQKYLENFNKLQRNARATSLALFGLGALAYTMAYMTADDDDLGRNAVATDNMEQWTRFARFHVPRGISEAMGLKEPLIFQIPWGFGLGAFAAAGAQIAGVVGGSQKLSEALPNIAVSVMLDSFVPIPVSRIPPTEAPFNWLLDTIAPSFIRPILEFTMNKNGLGRDINSASQRRMGDAYTGGDNIPEMWKDVARFAHNSTDGYLDVSPNTLYFMSNSYIDGISRIAESAYGISDVAQNRKDFSPKTDLPLLGSFFGSRASADARDFAKVEKEIQHMEKVINDFKTDPAEYARYTAKYPMDEAVVQIYNKMINKELNPLRAQDKTIRNDRNLVPADRKDLLHINQLQENLVKRQMIDMFKAYGVEP